jgi:hypothetical protein
MANKSKQAEKGENGDGKLVSVYRIMLNIVADWEQNEYGETKIDNLGCQTEERQLNDLANPRSETDTQQG